MFNNILLKEYRDIDYALIGRVGADGKSVYEYVCAWHYDKVEDDWGQGHYFFKLEDALEYLDAKMNEDNKEKYWHFVDDDGVHYTLWDLMENFTNSFLHDEYDGDFTSWLYDSMYHSCVLKRI